MYRLRFSLENLVNWFKCRFRKISSYLTPFLHLDPRMSEFCGFSNNHKSPLTPTWYRMFLFASNIQMKWNLLLSIACRDRYGLTYNFVGARLRSFNFLLSFTWVICRFTISRFTHSCRAWFGLVLRFSNGIRKSFICDEWILTDVLRWWQERHESSPTSIQCYHNGSHRNFLLVPSLILSERIFWNKFFPVSFLIQFHCPSSFSLK